jgi:hypothetical protein
VDGGVDVGISGGDAEEAALVIERARGEVVDRGRPRGRHPAIAPVLRGDREADSAGAAGSDLLGPGDSLLRDRAVNVGIVLAGGRQDLDALEAMMKGHGAA